MIQEEQVEGSSASLYSQGSDNLTPQMCSETLGNPKWILELRSQLGSTRNDQYYDDSNSDGTEASMLTVKSLHDFDRKLSKPSETFYKK